MTVFEYIEDFDNAELDYPEWIEQMTEAVLDYNEEFGTRHNPTSIVARYVAMAKKGIYGER